ncbi:DUF7536 family protein [Halobaculum sp. EA56]|uniref:DUF7536 family protein n=1 Tax=Halobaculum sp. EA56 TaxID=3421648 RepID=UPI003EB9BDBD
MNEDRADTDTDDADAGGVDAGGGVDTADPAPARPDRPPIAGLVEALSVKRNAAVGAAVGVALATVAYLVRALELLGPAGGTREYPVLGADGFFLMLAFVLASTTALLVATVLTVLAAVRVLRTPVE